MRLRNCLTILPGALALATALNTDSALAAPSAIEQRLAELEATQINLDFVWTTLAAALVFFMQGGFLLLESGVVRAKNSVNVAQKNIADMVVAVTMFGAVGFMLMFGHSQGGLFGFQWPLMTLSLVEDWTFAFFAFQVMFCGTAATITSGAVAERMRFSGYLWATVLISGLIYPLFGHWAWGNLLHGGNTAWLADLGFIDFAGSTVVHSVGAWVGLAAILILGPRKGRYDEQGRPVRFQGHSPVLATLGALILWIGWIGFNGGSTTAGTPAFAHIVVNTLAAGSVGGVAVMLAARIYDGVFRPERVINGVLGGLVAVTAGCDVLNAPGSVAVGVLGGLAAFAAHEVMDRKLKLDDPVGAVPVHGVAGALGTMLVAFLAPESALVADGRLAQFLVQLQGVAVAFIWAFGVGYIGLKLIDRFAGGLRVSPEDEDRGLNEAEHDTHLGTGELLQTMMSLAEGNLDLKTRLREGADSEAAELGYAFNRVMRRLERDAEAEAARRRERENAERSRVENERAAEARARERDAAVAAEIDRMVRTAREGDLSARLPTEDKEGVLRRVAGGLNDLTDVIDRIIGEFSDAFESLARNDLSRRVEIEAGGVFDRLRRDFNTTVHSLAEDIARLADSASTLDSAAQDIDSASDSLSESTDSQARALQATAAALEQIESGVEANARAARETDETAAAALAAVDEGTSLAAQASSAMQAVATGAARARDIVEMIDDLAFHTRLIALNASVEAARAGEAGQGFMVLAKEVAKLAEQSAEASQRIKTIIEDSSRSVDQGVDLVTRSDARLKDIHAMVRDMASRAADVARGTTEQASGVRDVNKRVENLDRIAARNAELAAETRGIAGRIAEEARRLSGFVQTFTLRQPARRLTAAGNAEA